ncbi:MAG: hypothetical protein ACHQE5_09770 [Actinomycetes bacterium]
MLLGALSGALLLACGSTASPTPAGSLGSGPTASSGTADPGAARLQQVLTALGKGYAFDATVKVGGAVATEAKGRWVGGASQFVLTSSGRSVTYRSVPPDAWVQQGDGSWIATQGTVPSGDPLAAFTSPLSVQSAGTLTDLTATYAPSTLGLTGSDPIAVTVHLGADGSMTVTYATNSTAGPATSTTAITPPTDSSPILAPGATPAPS